MDSNNNVLWIGLGIVAAVSLVFWILPPDITRALLYVVLFVGSVFMVLLVLIQRGRGGGLAGALGGMGGYSAFGTRAGDIFTRITIVAAALWILSAMALVKINSSDRGLYDEPGVVPKDTSSAGIESATSPEPGMGEEGIGGGATPPPATDSAPAAAGESDSASDKKADPGEANQP